MSTGSFTALAGGADIQYSVLMNATGLTEGLYTAKTVIAHNDGTKANPYEIPIDFFVFTDFHCPETTVLNREHRGGPYRATSQNQKCGQPASGSTLPNPVPTHCEPPFELRRESGSHSQVSTCRPDPDQRFPNVSSRSTANHTPMVFITESQRESQDEVLSGGNCSGIIPNQNSLTGGAGSTPGFRCRPIAPDSRRCASIRFGLQLAGLVQIALD